MVLNPVIEACIALARNPQLSMADVERIDIVGHPLLRERTDRPRVRSGREAQVSAQHAVAVALTRGKAGLAEFSDASVADPVLQDLGSKVAFSDDERYPVDSARVTVRLRDGARLDQIVEHAYGGVARPMSDADLEAKLRDLMTFGRVRRDPAPLLDVIWQLEHAPNAASVMALASAE